MQVQNARGRERKQAIVAELGGACACGYRKHVDALCFHHLDPTQKSFQLDMRSLSNRSMARIRTELRKCRLMCLNCHAEEHANLNGR